MNRIETEDNLEGEATVPAPKPKARRPDYLKQLRALANDQSLIEEFLDLTVVAAKHGTSGELGDLVLSTLSKLQASEDDEKFRNHCDIEVHSEKFAIFVLENHETIVASNRLARERFDIKAATTASDLDLVGPNGGPFAEIVIAAMEQRDPTNPIVPIAQAYSRKLKRRLDVAILHLSVCALMGITKEVILICDAITPATLKLFANKFGLTPAEASIVERFSAGQSLEEIASNRVRSLATVKTQFYKILEKCGAGSQSELLQMVARFESLNAATEGINVEFSHPHRRIFTLIRPGNRTLDVVSAGKPEGRPVLSCNSFSHKTFPAWMEEEFYQNNIKFYSIAPPGSGKTSPPPEGQSLEDCFAQDLVSVLDNIGCKQAVLSGSGTSFPLCLKTAHQIPNRIKAVFSSSVVVPDKWLEGEPSGNGLIPTIRTLTLGQRDPDGQIVSGAFFRLTTRLGVGGALRLALKNDKASRDIMLRPDHFEALKQAYDASVAQGLEFNIASFRSSLIEDWVPYLRSSQVPIHMVIGEEDTTGPYRALEQIVNQHPAKVSLTKVEGENSLYPYTKPDVFFAALNAVI